MISMAAITIRNLSDETHRALRARAMEHGRSTEAEVRAILDEAVRPAERLKMGSALVELFRPLGGVDLEIDRDRSPAEPPSFE
jgi:plasmid stability protein